MSPDAPSGEAWNSPLDAGLEPVCLLLGRELLRCNRAGRAVLVRILDLGPQCARQILLAFRGVKVGQAELGHVGGYGSRRLVGQFLIEADSLIVAARLVIEASQGQLGQVG